MRKPVSRACDACRRRKIKCNGLQPCPACSTASIQCTFRHEHRKGGNQGVRAVVLNELRRSTHSGSEPSVSPLRERGPDFLTPDFINACIEAYFAHLYPVVPFLTREALEHEAQAEDTGAKVFIASFCAYVVTYGPASSRSLAAYESNTEGPTLGQYLLDQAISILPADRASSPSYRVVLTSFFLYGTYAGLGNYRQGWFYLREAATLFMICEKPTENDLYSPVIVRRLFWILLISERFVTLDLSRSFADVNRAHGIRRGRPVTLQITPATPLLDLLEDPKGLQYLADLLLPFDDTFFAIWTGSGQECSKDWLLGVEERLRTALPAVLQVSNEQAANLRVSQLWLQIKMWELFPRFGFLSSSSTHECLTFRYPIGVAKKMASLDIALPIESMQIHGVGLVSAIHLTSWIPVNHSRRRRKYLMLHAHCLTSCPSYPIPPLLGPSIIFVRSLS